MTVLDGSPGERQQLYAMLGESDLFITSYSLLQQDAAILINPERRFQYVILDDAQAIKNPKTKTAQLAKQLNADYRLALTGTPLENHVTELWSIFDFLMPSFLGSYRHFLASYHRPIMERGDQEALTQLTRKTAPFMLRRTKQEVLKELPPKIEQDSYCPLSEAQTVLYQQIRAKVKGEVFAAVKTKGFAQAQIHILAGLTKLRQACNHPALLTKAKDWRQYESAKLELCLELIGEAMGSDRKVLVFSQFTSMLDILAEALEDQQIRFAYLSGQTKHRQEVIDEFTSDPTCSVFLISLKAGGTGLTLTAADTVILFDPWWNPSVERQATDRAHRIGQTRSVNVYRLLTVGTIEEKIQALKAKKQRLFDAVVLENQAFLEQLTWNDIRKLFTD